MHVSRTVIIKWMRAERKMSAHPFFLPPRFWFKLIQRAETDLTERTVSTWLEKHFIVLSGWLWGGFLSSWALWKSGRERGKWRENVDHVQYSDDGRARWTVVIGGKRNICSFLSYTWIAASHECWSLSQCAATGREVQIWSQGGYKKWWSFIILNRISSAALFSLWADVKLWFDCVNRLNDSRVSKKS